MHSKKYTQIDCKIIDIQPNKGKGNAIKQGVLQATQKWILCNDADLSYSMFQIDEWIENNWIDFDATHCVYFGSRELGMKKVGSVSYTPKNYRKSLRNDHSFVYRHYNNRYTMRF